MEPFKCIICGKDGIKKKPNQIVCSKTCRLEHHRRILWVPTGINESISNGRVGSIAELAVCIDLLKKGYDVYRAISPASHADLIAVKNDQMIKLEVRTGRYQKNGRLTYPTHKTSGKSVVLVTHNDSKVHYLTNPELGFNVDSGPYNNSINESNSSELLLEKLN